MSPSQAIWRSLSVRLFSFFALFVFVALVLTPRAFAQGGLASVNGTVTDTSHAVVPTAAVTLTNEKSGETRVAVTNGSGFFSFVGVPQGTYSVTVTKQGFSALNKTNIVANAYGSVSVTGLTLHPGSMTQTVSVKGNAYYAVPLNSGSKKEVITSQQIQNTLVEGRDAIELLKILPGVVNFGYNQNGASGYGSGVGNNTFSINGTRGDTIQESFDGADNIDPGNNGGNATVPDVDMISQVTVQTSNFSAANPQGPTVMSFITKSGGRQYHGEAYYSTRPSGLAANSWQNNANGVTRPASSFQYPGFNIGGPVPGMHNKLFFFAGYEYMKQNQDTGFNQTVVATPGERAGNFTNDLWSCKPGSTSNVAGCPANGQVPGFPAWGTYGNNANVPCVSGNENYNTPVQPDCLGVGIMNPAAFDAGGLALYKLIPPPNTNPSLHNGNNFVNDAVVPANHQTLRARMDYDFSQNTKLYAVFGRDSELGGMPYGLWWGGSSVPYPGNEQGTDHSYQFSGTLLNTLSPTMTNELQVGLTRIVFNDGLANPNLSSLSGTGYPYQGLYKNTLGFVPSFMTWGGGFPTLLNAQGNPGPNSFAHKWLNTIRDDISIVKGNHQIKMGAYFEHVTNTQPVGDSRGTAQIGWGGCDACGWDPADTNNGYGDLLIGTIGTGGWSQSNTTLTGYTYYNDIEGYAQDSWKATPQLTLNYGVRAYYMPFMAESGGREATFSGPGYKGPTCFNPGISGCYYPGTTPADSAQQATGGNPAYGYSSLTGLSAHVLNPSTPWGGFPNPGVLFAPNFGFAYDLFGSGNTVIRGGFGMNYYRDEGNFFFGAIQNPPFLLNSSPGNVATLRAANDPANIPNLGAVGLTVLDPHNNRVPMTESYSFTVSQRVGFQTVLEVSYVGNSSFHQDTPGGTGNGGINYNLVPQGAEYTFRQDCNLKNPPSNLNCGAASDYWWAPFQNYQGITFNTHSLNQNYNSLQITATRTTGRLSYAASYTFSKALGVSGIFNSNGNTVDPYNYRGRSYGPLPYDRSQVFNVTYSFLLPNWGTQWFGGNAIADGFMNGWQFSGISSISSGPPMTFGVGSTGGVNFSSDFINGDPGGTVHSFVVCNPTAALKPNQYYNAACFQSPSPGHNGDYQQPYIHGPSFMSNDLGVFKNFAIGKSESQKIQLRIEGYNFLNHPYWITSSLDTGVNFQGYGQAPVNSLPTRVGGSAAGYLTQKNGNRVMEIELKYIF